MAKCSSTSPRARSDARKPPGSYTSAGARELATGSSSGFR
jgi:hypothetical protein